MTYLQDGGSLSVNHVLHDALPLLHALLAVFLQGCVTLLHCFELDLPALLDQAVVLLHDNIHRYWICFVWIAGIEIAFKFSDVRPCLSMAHHVCSSQAAHVWDIYDV